MNASVTTLAIATLAALAVTADDVYDKEEKAAKACARATKKDGKAREVVQVEEGGFYFRLVAEEPKADEPNTEVHTDEAGNVTGANIEGTEITIEQVAELPKGKGKKAASPYPWLKKFVDGLVAEGVQVADLSLVPKDKSILLRRGNKNITWFTGARRQEYANVTMAELSKREAETKPADTSEPSGEQQPSGDGSEHPTA